MLHPLTSITERLDLGKLFPKNQLLEVELGSGDGSFLVQYAALHSDRNFIAVERLLGRIRKTEKKATHAGLTNLRGIRIESSYFLEYLLPPRSATVLHIYFPDPWPKRKHWKNRLINERFPDLAYQTLAGEGRIFLRTDDAAYYKQMLGVFASDQRFRRIDTPPELIVMLTDFEREFQRRGIQTLRAAFEKAEG